MQSVGKPDLTFAPIYGPIIPNMLPHDDLQLPKSILSLTTNNNVERGILFSSGERSIGEHSHNHTIINFFKVLRDTKSTHLYL